jgi:cytochrome c553
MTRRNTRLFGGLTLLVCAVAAAIAAPKIVGDPAKGEALAKEACAACHGVDGNSPDMPNLPKLAGQHPPYLVQQLHEFKAGLRPSDAMQGFAANLSDADMANLALYFAAQKPTPGKVARPELVEKGKKIYFNGNSANGVPSCDGCHEENGAGSDKFPRISAQNPEYTHEEFKRYAEGKRPNGKKVMRTVAERLTPEETEALAQYLASLP